MGIGRDTLRLALGHVNESPQEAPRGVLVAVLAAHGVQEVALPIDGAVERAPAPGALGYDPFAGSGSTLIAAEQLGRRCTALEIEPRYVDVIVQRWQNATGGTATLADDGRTFAQMQAVRHGR